MRWFAQGNQKELGREIFMSMKRRFRTVKSFMRFILIFALASQFIHPVSAQAVLTNPTPDCSAGTTCTITFTNASDYYAWTVPSGVTSITFTVRGASGGRGCYVMFSRGGFGAVVTGTQSVSSGSTLYIGVGSAGSDAYVGSVGTCSSSGSASSGSAGTNPFSSNGGGTTNSHPSAKGGGGGAASEIRLGSTSAASRIIVAGGGGGGGANHGNGRDTGGDASGNTGQSGSSSGSVGTLYTGKGGTISSGGAGGGLGSTSGGSGFGGGGVGGGGGGGGGYFGGGGSYFEGGGAGSSWVSNATSVTYSSFSSASNGIVSLTYSNSPTPTTFSTSQTSPTNIGTGSTISYSLVLSQSVSDLATSDFQFGGTSSCNTPGLSGSGTTYTVTVTNCSEGTLILQLKANSVTGTSTGPPSVSSANTVVIDRTAPTISSVSAPANKTYIPAETPTFTVAFSESVTVTGTPRLVLTVGSLTEYADYVSMSDSRTARFRYTVALDANEFDTDGIALSTTLDANGGSIADLASNALTNFGLSAPTLTSVLVAQPPGAPTITSITPASGQLSVAFTAGATRGSAITSYQYSTDNGSTWKTRASGSDGSPVVITTVSATASSLANGTSYNVRLRAVNAAGNSDSSTAVAATPSAITVSGDSTLTTTYGTAASTGTYSATGGTGPYTFTLSSSATGVSISSGVVSVSSTAPAGTYVRNVVATDNASQTGSRQLTITINKASTSITISLPNSATDAALGGAITITATVSQAGSVNFRLGGTTISGCGSVSSSAGSATCSWTPGSLGGATLSAVLTPTDSGNYDGATSTNLSITVVNGVTTVSMSLAGGVTQASRGQNIVITATVDQAGRISFFADGKRISGCFNRAVSGSSATCTWKPAIQKQVNLTSRLVPTNSAFSTATTTLQVMVVRRTGTR